MQYQDYAKQKGYFATGIHTRITDSYRISSAYRRFSNPHFISLGWETILWIDDKITHQYKVLNNADDVINLHAKIQDHFWNKGKFYKEYE